MRLFHPIVSFQEVNHLLGSDPSACMALLQVTQERLKPGGQVHVRTLAPSVASSGLSDLSTIG